MISKELLSAVLKTEINSIGAQFMNNTIILTEEQLEAFNRGEPITLRRQFSYPAYFKNITFGFVVKFTGLTTGEIVKEDAEKDWGIGRISTKWIEHTRTDIWEYLPNYKEVTKWEPQRGEWYVSAFGIVYNDYSVGETQFYGVERQTEEEAQYAAQQMRIHNRLLAYVAEFDKGWKADWTNADQSKYFVDFNHVTNEYYANKRVCSRTIGQVYMSKECAEELCSKLNSGEVVL